MGNQGGAIHGSGTPDGAPVAELEAVAASMAVSGDRQRAQAATVEAGDGDQQRHTLPRNDNDEHKKAVQPCINVIST